MFEVTIDEQGEVIDVQVLGGNAILVGQPTKLSDNGATLLCC